MRLLPKSLFGRLVLVLVTGLFLAQLLSAFILLRDRGQVLYESIRENLIGRTAGIVRLLDSLPPPERRELLPLLASPEMHISLSAQSIAISEPEGESSLASAVVLEQLLKRLPENTQAHVSLEGRLIDPRTPMMHRRHMRGEGRMQGPWAYMRGPHAMAKFFLIQVRLQDGTWVHFQRGLSERLFDWPSRLLFVLGMLLLSVVLLSLVSVRWIIRPLRDLRKAAEGLGKDIQRPPLEESGPSEVRETAKAFNTMQNRLKNYIEDRAGILAAVSHDLKTPLTRIRLRADLMDDEEMRRKTQNDLDDMESMVSATLEFMRGTETREPSRRIDLMALLESIRDDALEAGEKVELMGQTHTPYEGKPLALKRCIVNLVENAVRYGGQADIAVEDSEKEVTLSICDNGPGIPEQALEKVFDPFYRLESSRARDTGGTGLGLGIARNIARAHGGDILLRNRPDAGLCAEVRLPRL